MKFQCSVDINLPRDQVREYWDNVEYIKEWQDGLQSFEHISGEPGKVGAVSKMRYKAGKREFDLVETILLSDLPNRFKGEYVADSMTNTMDNTFEILSEHQTRWVADIEYSKFNGFLPKLMGLLFKGMFKKQTQKWLNQFKTFAENKAAEQSA